MRTSSSRIALRTVDLEQDLPALMALLSLQAKEGLTVEEVRERWIRAKDAPRFARLALNDREQVVGMIDVGRSGWTRPGCLYLSLIVDPARRNQGIGTWMLEEGLRFARTQDARWVEAKVSEDAPHALRFAERRGFVVRCHVFDSRLDLTSFDETPFVAALENGRAAGLRFFSLADLEPVTERAQRKLYDLNRRTGLDNPGNEGEFPPFEAFREFILQASWYRADGQIVAADGERWVGLAAVAFYPHSNSAYNAFTGVDRDYRGRGLGYALKLMAIRWAQQCGASYIRTSNDSRNAPMLAINRRLGYRPEPGTYYLVRELRGKSAR